MTIFLLWSQNNEYFLTEPFDPTSWGLRINILIFILMNFTACLLKFRTFFWSKWISSKWYWLKDFTGHVHIRAESEPWPEIQARSNWWPCYALLGTLSDYLHKIFILFLELKRWKTNISDFIKANSDYSFYQNSIFKPLNGFSIFFL